MPPGVHLLLDMQIIQQTLFRAQRRSPLTKTSVQKSGHTAHIFKSHLAAARDVQLKSDQVWGAMRILQRRFNCNSRACSRRDYCY